MVIKAFILLTVDTALTRQVVETLRANPSLKEVYEVLGPYDIIVEMEASELDEITRVLREEVRTIPGVRSTLTCVTFPHPRLRS